MIVDEIYFDSEFWCSMKNKFQKYYEHFFLGLLSMGRAMPLSNRITVSTGIILKKINNHDFIIIQYPRVLL